MARSRLSMAGIVNDEQVVRPVFLVYEVCNMMVDLILRRLIRYSTYAFVVDFIVEIVFENPLE